MVRPKKRPDNIEPIPEYLQTERMLRPMSKEQVKESTKQTKLAEDFGDFEYRAELESQLSWNPIARLGFDPSVHKVLKPSAEKEYVALQLKKGDLEKRLLKEGFSERDAKEGKAGNILTTSNISFPSVISHEFTHRGFDALIKKRNKDPKSFDEKYGEKAGRILQDIKDKNFEEEYYVELFDDLNYRFNTGVGFEKEFENFPKQTIKSTVQSSPYGPDIDLKENKNLKSRRIEQIRAFQDRELKRRDKGKGPNPYSFAYPSRFNTIDTGILDLMDAAQDILTEQGEPPKAKETSGFIKTLRKFFGSDRRKLEPSYSEGGLETGDITNQTESAIPTKKGMSYGELILDNILGLDNEYESFGEKLGKAVNEDEIDFLKTAAVGVYEGAKEFITNPVETTKQVVTDIKDSVQRLGTEDLNKRLKNMYNIDYTNATDEQVNSAKEAVFGDALRALELIPAAKGVTTIAKAGSAAIPSGVKADVIGQTKALLSGDKEFLSGTPTPQSSTQSLSAGFTGQNPPTYLKRDVPFIEGKQPGFKIENPEDPEYMQNVVKDDLNKLRSLDYLSFREPIVEFAETVTIPKKGLLGSEFLLQLKKNDATPESSLQSGVIDPDKRYTKEELLSTLKRDTKDPFSVLRQPKGTFESSADLRYPSRYESYQRQHSVGFMGGIEQDDFSIPIESNIGTPGKKFKAKGDLHGFPDETIAHVRGSIQKTIPLPNKIKTTTEAEQIAKGKQLGINRYISPEELMNAQRSRSNTNFNEYFNIIGHEKNFLLFEEGQSDLLTGGFIKPTNKFDAVFQLAIDDYNDVSPVSYREAYSGITKDIEQIVKELDNDALGGFDKPSPSILGTYSYSRKKDFLDTAKERGYVAFSELDNYLKSNGYYNATNIDKTNADTEEFIEQSIFAKDIALLDDVDDYDEIILEGDDLRDDITLMSFDNNDGTALKSFLKYRNKKGPPKTKEQYKLQLDNFYNRIQKQLDRKKIDKEIDALEFADIYLYYKNNKSSTLDTSNIGLPPIRKEKQAIDEIIKVLIAKAAASDAESIVIPPPARIAAARGKEYRKSKGDKFYRLYEDTFNKSLKELEDNFPVTIHRNVELPYGGTTKSTSFPEIDNKGTIIDISELVRKYKVEKPRQFAQGGVAMKDQMDLFKYGGLKDDGLTKDPVSGNEIPDGSMAKEVRDDIPAMLSEGEYVVPADVLRYYGMGFFENLRNQAKNSLTQMETSGRIGGEPISPEQAQRNMQIKPMGMPQPQAVNQGGVIQGFNNGNQVTSSGITPLEIRGAAYQTTSSYQDNVAKAEAEASTNTEEITVMKPHYGKNGEGPVQIAYVGSDINNLTVKSGQEELIKQYPLTKEEYDLFKKDTSFSGDDDPENPETPTGSSTAWMDGIDFTSDASVEAEVEKILKPGAAGILGMGGPLLKGLSLFATGNKVGKARGLESWARASGKTTLADKIKNMITSNVNSNALSLFDKLGVAQGTYSLDQINAKIEEEGIVIGGGVAPPTPPGSAKKINIGGTDVNIKGPIDITKLLPATVIFTLLSSPTVAKGNLANESNPNIIFIILIKETVGMVEYCLHHRVISLFKPSRKS